MLLEAWDREGLKTGKRRGQGSGRSGVRGRVMGRQREGDWERSDHKENHAAPERKRPMCFKGDCPPLVGISKASL